MPKYWYLAIISMLSQSDGFSFNTRKISVFSNFIRTSLSYAAKPPDDTDNRWKNIIDVEFTIENDNYSNGAVNPNQARGNNQAANRSWRSWNNGHVNSCSNNHYYYTEAPNWSKDNGIGSARGGHNVNDQAVHWSNIGVNSEYVHKHVNGNANGHRNGHTNGDSSRTNGHTNGDSSRTNGHTHVRGMQNNVDGPQVFVEDDFCYADQVMERREYSYSARPFMHGIAPPGMYEDAERESLLKELARLKAKQKDRERQEAQARKGFKKREAVEAEIIDEARAREEAEEIARMQAEARARAQAEVRAKAEAEARARAEAEARARAEAEAKAREEARRRKEYAARQAETERRKRLEEQARVEAEEALDKNREGHTLTPPEYTCWSNGHDNTQIDSGVDGRVKAPAFSSAAPNASLGIPFPRQAVAPPSVCEEAEQKSLRVELERLKKEARQREEASAKKQAVALEAGMLTTGEAAAIEMQASQQAERPRPLWKKLFFFLFLFRD